MLRQSSSKKNAHVAWDEENLKVNLEIQKEYSGVKIQEPKTPYRPPLPDAELGDEEMRPLELDDEGNVTYTLHLPDLITAEHPWLRHGWRVYPWSSNTIAQAGLCHATLQSSSPVYALHVMLYRHDVCRAVRCLTNCAMP